MLLGAPPRVESKGNLSVGFSYFLAIFTVVFFLSGVSAQEIRSGWNLVGSSTDSDLLASEYHDGEFWVFGENGIMLRSVDEGVTWQQAEKLADDDLTASDSNFGTMAVAGNSGSIHIMFEDGWRDFSQPDLIDEISDIALTSNNSLVLLSGNSIWNCEISDGDLGCESVWNEPENSLNGVSFLDSENGLVAADGGIIVATTDGGDTWEYRDAPEEIGASDIVEITYYSSIRAYAISEDGHIIKSSREGNVPVGFVWSIVEIEREYPAGGGDEFEAGGSELNNRVSKLEVVGQFKILMVGPDGYVSLSLDGGNIVSQQMVPISNTTMLNSISMKDGFKGVIVGDGGVILRTENAGTEEFVGFEVADFGDFGQFVDYSKERLMDGLVATAKIVFFGILMGFSLGVTLSMLKTSPVTLKNVAQTNRYQILLSLAIVPVWTILAIPISIFRLIGLGMSNPLDSSLAKYREKSADIAANMPINIISIRVFGTVLVIFGVYRIFEMLDEINSLNLDGWEHIYSPIGAPVAVFWIILGFAISLLGGIFISCNGDFSIRNYDFKGRSFSLNPWGIKPLNTIATAYTDIFRNTPLLVQFMFIHFGFELGRRFQEPGLMLLDFDYVQQNANFITDFFIIYETDPDSLAYRRPIGGILQDRAYISAIFALGLNSGAYQCETIRGAIAAIPSGQMEAGRSIGLNYMQSMRLVVMPQAVRICIPPLGNEMVNLVLNSSLAMIIGYAEITRQGKLIVATTFQVFWTWGMVLISYFLITWTLALFLRYLEEKTRIPGLGISGGA